MTDNHEESLFVEPLGGYGRVWQSMYEGSLAGSGLAVFAVWPYVIANMRPHLEFGAAVDLNPKILAAKLGGQVGEITEAIERLCDPDPQSHNQAEGGRRLVKISGMQYRVVNGANFMAIRRVERQRELHRAAQARYRERPAREAKKKSLLKSPGTLAERLALQAEKEGDGEMLARLSEVDRAKRQQNEAFQRKMAETIAAVQSDSYEKESLSGDEGEGGMPPEGVDGEKFPEV